MRPYRKITTARVDTTDPRHSLDYQDYYFSLKDPLAERQVVFIEGLQLPTRFQRMPRQSLVRIGETGFGAGLTFLLAAQCFLRHAPSDARLQWVSTELHPLRAADRTRLLDALAMPHGVTALAEQLKTVWPDPVAGAHRRLFADGRIVLDLHFADATEVFSQLHGVIDAWCLDGFSPEHNPDLWSPALFHAIAQRSVHGAPLSTYTAASKVRIGLTEAGFEVHKHTGFAGKRERLSGVFQGQPEYAPFAPPVRSTGTEEVVIIGGGLSGAWVARGLANRGFAVRVFERQTIASGGSGNRQGVTYAKLSLESTPASQIQLQALTHLQYWLADAPSWHPTGVLLLADSADAQQHQHRLLEALGLPDHIVSAVDQPLASDIAEVKLTAGGLLLHQGGWLDPKATVEWLLGHANIQVELYQRVEAAELLGTETLLTLSTATGVRHHPAQVVIWANADEAARFSVMALPLRPVRGQITKLKTTLGPALPVCGDAYVAPVASGMLTCGASYQPKSTDLTPRANENFDNLKRAQSLFAQPLFTQQMISGERVAIRASTPDYAPMVGQLADPDIWQSRLRGLSSDATALPDQPLSWIPGHYVIAGQGSRGTLTAPLTAEILVSQIAGETSPVSESTRHALSPDRFFRRALIRGQHTG